MLALVALPLIGSPRTWLTLTVAGLAMGMMIFIMASGLTLVFGLMDVLNFGHGAFIARRRLSSRPACSCRSPAGCRRDSLWLNLAAVLAPRIAGGDGGDRRARAGLRARASCGRSTAST